MDFATEESEGANSLKSPSKILFWTYFVLVILIALILIISHLLEIPIEHFTADPAVTYNAHPLTGAISHIGVLIWCSAAVACIFSFVILRINTRRRDSWFLFWSGVVTAVLVIDDLFMFHEAIFPWYFHVPQKLVYVGYVLMITGYFYYFRNQILNSEYYILLTAVVFLGFSVVGDFVLPQEGIAYLVEDGFKLFGIATWFIYYWRTSLKWVLE